MSRQRRERRDQKRLEEYTGRRCAKCGNPMPVEMFAKHIEETKREYEKKGGAAQFVHVCLMCKTMHRETASGEFRRLTAGEEFAVRTKSNLGEIADVLPPDQYSLIKDRDATEPLFEET